MPKGIEHSLLSAIIEGRMRPGSRLSENQLAEVFGVSRTLIREALARLANRHVVSVTPRKGWFVNAPDEAEAVAVFAARRSVEFGFLSTAKAFDVAQIARIRAHLDEERRAIDSGDKAQLTYLMGDFHVCIVAQSGNQPLIEIIRNLTARTILISLCFQSNRNALSSHEDHLMIFDALAAGDMPRAAQLSLEHLEDVEAGLKMDIAPTPLDTLRNTLRLEMAPNGVGKERAPD
jgi:DNA-binding GntR family transcriptional regulator